MQTTTVFTGYDTRSGTSAKTGNPWTMHLFKDKDDKSFQTFDTALANELAGTRGQEVTIEWEPEQRGDFTNNVVTKLVAASASKPTMTGYAPADAPYVMAPAAGPSQKDITIWRQTATKVAAHLGASSYEELIGMAEKIVAYYRDGAQPASPSTADSAGAASAAAPAAGSAVDEFPDW